MRDASLDIAKAIAIVAIVFGHVWRGLYSAGAIADWVLFASVDTAVYSWHLTVFAFTAGLFVQRGMKRSGAWEYTRTRDTTFIWLYLVWSLIQGLTKVAAASLVNTPSMLSDVLHIWVPEGQLWFFGWIALMMILAAATQLWRSRTRSLIVVVVCCLSSIALWGWQGPYLGMQGLALTGFFVIAVWARGDRVLRVLRAVPTAVLCAITVLGVVVIGANAWTGWGTVPTEGFDERTTLSVIVGVIVAIVGLVAVLSLARLLALTRVSSALARIGERSLVIFVAHIVFAAGARIVLARAGVGDLIVQVIMGTVVGVAGPLCLYWLTRRLGFAWLFSAPAWLRGGSRTRRKSS